MVTTYSYNKLNRLTDEVAKNAGGTLLASYSHTLDNAGNRTGVTETQLLPNGTVNIRTVAYQYDNLYRLLSETITGDSQGGNGIITYTFSLTGNRMARTSSVAGVATSTSTYNANDELTSEVSGGVTTNYSYDANGNTIESVTGNQSPVTFVYDSQNHLVKQDAGQTNEVDITYDGAGNKVSETVNGVTTIYLVDTNNPTGYSQIVEEIVNGAVTGRYTLGHWIISETQNISETWTTSFYGYDGHNSVRFLTNAAGTVTDNYTFDAFGIKIASAGSTPNQILYSGEYLDLGTGNYALRNRIYRQNTGTFLTADTTPGQLPYVYTSDNPVMFVDPSGRGLLSVAVDLTIELSLDVKNFAVSVYAGVRAADAAELAVISFNATAAGTENVVFGPRNLPDLELFSIGFGAGLLQGLVALRAPTIGAALGTAMENTANQYFSDPTHVFSWDSLAKLALAETENVGGLLFVRGMLNEIDLSPLAKVLISTDVNLVRGDVIGLITSFEGH